MTMQILRHRGLDERRARAIGAAMLADDRNVDPSICHKQVSGGTHIVPYTVAGVRAVDGVILLDQRMARHEAAPLIAAALESSCTGLSGSIDGLAEEIRQAVMSSPEIADLPVGSGITLLCGTPWSRQEAICYGPAGGVAVPLDLAGIPQAAEAGLSMRLLNIARFQWIGRITQNAPGCTPTVETESAGVW